MIKKISTIGMSREEWLQHRMKSIGGSDAGALLGLNPYKSPYALWAEKTGEVTPDDISDKEAVRLGNDLEDYVAMRWMEKTGKKLRRDNNILYNTDYPFAHANIDRAVVGEPDAGFEAKTTSNFELLKKLKAGQIPDSWYCQVCHYMMVTGAKRWYLGALAFGGGFFEFTIERDEGEINSLEDAERTFWDRVERHVPPDADGTESTMDTLKTMFLGSRPGVVDLTPLTQEIEVYNTMAEQIKTLEERKNSAQAKIMQYMGEFETGISGNCKISWKSQSRKTFDKKSFERDHGQIGSEYFKETTSRPFKISIKTEE